MKYVCGSLNGVILLITNTDRQSAMRNNILADDSELTLLKTVRSYRRRNWMQCPLLLMNNGPHGSLLVCPQVSVRRSIRLFVIWDRMITVLTTRGEPS